MHVAREPVELGDGDRAPLSVAAGDSQGGSELRAAVERVGTLACLDLDMLGDDFEALGLGEAGDGGSLSVNAKPRAALLASAERRRRRVPTLLRALRAGAPLPSRRRATRSLSAPAACPDPADRLGADPPAIRRDGEVRYRAAPRHRGDRPFAVASDPAAEYAFVNRVIQTIQKGGWKWTQYSEGAMSLPTGDEAISRGSGLQIRINRSRFDDFGGPAEALARALTDALGQSVSVAFDPPESPQACSPDVIHVEIYKVR